MDAILEKMCDLHDKLSDAIHSVSRAQYIRTKNADVASLHPRKTTGGDSGFVFAKVVPDAYFEAKSLDAIRAALENFEEQIEFFQTVQVQQRAERDAAIARIEQSRIFLARRLSEHHGKKYKVIEEALAFVGETSQFVSTNYSSDLCPPGNKSVTNRGSFNIIKVIVSSFDFAKKCLNIKEMGGVLGNAALVALSMLALLHLHQMGSEDKYFLGLPLKQESAFYSRNAGSYRSEKPSSSDHLAHLDVTLARG